MLILLNGENIEIAECSTVTGLLEHLHVGKERVAVEVNKNIVAKKNHDSHILSAGDRIEIVQFVGGG